MLADWLDCFPAVLEALSVHLEMTALVLVTAAGATFETRHNHLGGGHILATVAHNLEIGGLRWCLVVNCCVSCWMEIGDKTVECLEMAPVKEGIHTHEADVIHWRVAQIDCLGQWQFVNHYLRMLNCRQATVASQSGHAVETYSLSAIEIPSWTCSVNNDGGKLLYLHDMM